MLCLVSLSFSRQHSDFVILILSMLVIWAVL